MISIVGICENFAANNALCICILIISKMPCVFQLQLIGISVPGLEAEFQPVANYLLPYIISHKQDAVDMHLQVN